MTTSFFHSREEANNWFARETRQLPMPDGTTRSHADCRLTWRSFDFILERGLFTGPELVRLAVQTAQANGASFEGTFTNVLAYVHDEYLKSLSNDDLPLSGAVSVPY